MAVDGVQGRERRTSGCMVGPEQRQHRLAAPPCQFLSGSPRCPQRRGPHTCASVSLGTRAAPSRDASSMAMCGPTCRPVCCASCCSRWTSLRCRGRAGARCVANAAHEAGSARQRRRARAARPTPHTRRRRQPPAASTGQTHAAAQRRLTFGSAARLSPRSARQRLGAGCASAAWAAGARRPARLAAAPTQTAWTRRSASCRPPAGTGPPGPTEGTAYGSGRVGGGSWVRHAGGGAAGRGRARCRRSGHAWRVLRGAATSASQHTQVARHGQGA